MKTLSPTRLTERNNQLSVYRDAIEKGVAWLMAPGSEKLGLRVAMPALATSNTADAWLLGIWTGYHGMGRIIHIRKSRGYTWTITTERRGSYLVEIVNPYDHREGVQVRAELP